MMQPHFKKDNKNIPILRKIDIDAIAENYVREYQPDIISNPQPFDVEGFMERHLELTLDYQYLSNDGRYLGMTIFNDTHKVIVYVPERNIADYIHATAGTIIIDNTLLEQLQEGRYRYTLGHECGHWIFHREHFSYNPTQLKLFNDDNEPFLLCREINNDYFNRYNLKWDSDHWLEWQADKFSAGILMPTTSVANLVEKLIRKNISESEIISKVSDVYNVSMEAAYYRLCDLDYIIYEAAKSKNLKLSFI